MAGVGMYGATTPRAVATVPRHDDSAVAPSAHNGRKARVAVGVFCTAIAVVGVAAASSRRGDLFGGDAGTLALPAAGEPSSAARHSPVTPSALAPTSAAAAAWSAGAVTPAAALSTSRAPNLCDASVLTFHYVDSIFGARYVTTYFEHLWAKVRIVKSFES